MTLIGKTVRWCVPSTALAWNAAEPLDGYLPPAPAGWAWYWIPFHRPARPEEMQPQRGPLLMKGGICVQVSYGRRHELRPFPPRVSGEENDT